MSRAAEQQAEFSAGLLAAEAVLPAGWVGPDGQPDAKRFGVYRNNVASSLMDALREGYPAVHRLVGDEYFSALAKVFMQANPPESPVMLEYGAAFPAFLQGFEPLAGLPYLPDVARIERAWHEAYHSPDDSSMALEVLTRTLDTVAAERAGELHLELHPSVHVVRSPWPALTIWLMNVGEGSAEPIDLSSGGEDVLVSRPQAQVRVRPMPAGEAAFLQSLQAGASLGEAAQYSLEHHPEFELGARLAALLSDGLVRRVWLPEESSVRED